VIFDSAGAGVGGLLTVKHFANGHFGWAGNSQVLSGQDSAVGRAYCVTAERGGQSAGKDLRTRHGTHHYPSRKVTSNITRPDQSRPNATVGPQEGVREVARQRVDSLRP